MIVKFIELLVSINAKASVCLLEHRAAGGGF